MRRKTSNFLIALLLVMGFASCSNDNDGVGNEPLPKGTTHMSITLSLPNQSSRLRAAGDDDYNRAGIYSGFTEINTVDIYLLSSDGATITYSNRFSSLSDFSFSAAPDGSDVIMLNTPFKTTPGDKKMIVIINSPYPLRTTTVPPDDYRYVLSSSLPLSSLARISSNAPTSTPSGPVYSDVLVLTGKSGLFTIEDNVSAQDVISLSKNTVPVSVVRIPSRAIVTSTAPTTVVDENSVTLGTISNVTYSVAQGANSVYMFSQTNADNTTKTWGYDYVPGTDYIATSATYYDYSDLQSITDAIPAKPIDGSHITFPGKFFLENTHLSGTNATNSNYKKGNTAYVLVRATFTPAPAIIADGGILTNGTFYVGGVDGKVYSSIQNAQDYNIGVSNQPVATYTNGKVLYYIWLNPDNIQRPVNSPTVRNHIYHVNINSFKSIGINWNPLTPDVNNPDPQPVGPEPVNPIDPVEPLSPTDTYMSVDITVLSWTVHSYDIDL